MSDEPGSVRLKIKADSMRVSSLESNLEGNPPFSRVEFDADCNGVVKAEATLAYMPLEIDGVFVMRCWHPGQQTFLPVKQIEFVNGDVWNADPLPESVES